MEPSVWSFQTIGHVRSPFREKFGVPRQPGLVKTARGQIDLLPPFNTPEAVRGLEGFSHLWVLFIFHQHVDQGWSPLVRPPRLGGNRKCGVFASRSPFRPNPIGLSVVRVEEIKITEGAVSLVFSGGDFVDGTPVVDLKPYVPYADSLPDAVGGFAEGAPDAALELCYEEDALLALVHFSREYPDLPELLAESLRADPRPAYHQTDRKTYFLCLHDLEIRFRVIDLECRVESITRRRPAPHAD